jgi:drug/metabolite transporter (DMT)-like permease
MKLKIAAFIAFLLNTFLYGTYYAVSKEALERIDPIVFTFFVMMALVPVALCALVFSWKQITREAVKSGILLGSCLCLGLFTLSVALKQNSATSTAFFPSLNGFLAALCVWLFLRQPILKATWLAGAISVGGALLLILNSPMGGVRSSLIAFIGGLFCTLYVFLADHEQQKHKSHWPLFSIQLLTMALWANLLALLFGDWHAVQPALPKDIWVILYISLVTTCLPTLITVLLQKHISPVTVSFIYILEPVLGAVFANFYLQEVLPFYGYAGGGLIVIGALIHTWGTTRQSTAQSEQALHSRLLLTGGRISRSRLTMLLYPVLCFVVGGFILYRIGGLPPLAWSQLYRLGPKLPILFQQYSGATLLLLIQALCWLIAWIALIGLGVLVAQRTKRLLTPEAPVKEEWNMRALRLMGVTSHVTSQVRTREEKQLVQRRRRERQVRLAHLELVE